MRDFLIAICLIALTYVGSYVALSLCGQYEPAIWGASGVKFYGWAPAGFYDRKWNSALLTFYYPLYCADVRLWHRLQPA
jgi:hypothetical protein